MNVKNSFFLIIIITIITAVGCINLESNKNNETEFICNKPYIQVGYKCCLDLNNNMICDEEEEKTEIKEEINNTLKLPQMQESIVHIQHTYGLGSGVIIEHDKGTLILTNKHVLEDANGMNDIKITLDNDEIIYPNEVYYAPHDLDIALIKYYDIRGKAALTSNETKIERGKEVYLIGSPMGLSKSVSSGIISNVQTINTTENYTYKIIQTDAAVNPGNSGGGLFLKENGELIGIVTYAIASQYGQEGLGFAITLNEYFKLPKYNSWDKFKKSLRCDDDTPYYLCSKNNVGMVCYDDSKLYWYCSYCGCPKEYYCMPYSYECFKCDKKDYFPWDLTEYGYGYACCPKEEEPFLIDDNNYGCCPPDTTPYVGDYNYICCKDGYIGAINDYEELACCPKGTYYGNDRRCHKN